MADHLHILPASFAQQRLWFLDQLFPGNPFYNLSTVLHLPSSLEPDVVRRALIELASRHETLRTTFATVDGRPVQVLSADPQFPLAIEDLRTLPSTEQRAAAARHARDHARTTFELSKGPLARAVLFQQEHDAMLCVCLHHIIADGWSLGVLGRELTTLIDATAEGRSAALPALPIQYGDYAVWQCARLQGRRLEELLAYWRPRLAGLPTLDLPTDRPRPATPTFHGARVPWRIAPPLTRALRALAREEDATVFMILLSVFAALLARYAGQHDVPIGSPAANRDRAEVEGLIGLFVNTLVLRVDLSGAPSLRELLRRVRRTTQDALAHQELPFERLVEELSPERSLSRSPLVQVMFQFFDDPSAGRRRAELPDDPSAALDFDRRTAAFDIACTGWPSGSGVAGLLEYATDLFDAATCERLVAHMLELLRRAAGEPDRPLGEFPLLSPEDYVRQVDDWNATTRALPAADLIELFQDCVRRWPDAVAVDAPSTTLSYAGLDARATALAAYLQRHGVDANARVAILLERGALWIEAMLAVVMAGGVYVPLDEESPPSRLALIISDAAPTLILTSRTLATRLPDGCACLLLDAIDPEPADSRRVARRPEDLVYVIYTSGSTGAPKGVAVPQRAVVRLVRETDYIAMAPSDRVAQASTMAFDAATFELWGTLLNGASLHLLSREDLLDPERLEGALRERSISVLFLTTALLNQVVNARPAAFAPLRVLLFGGELVDVAAVRRLLRHGPPRELLHVYGPTENTTFSTWHRITDVSDTARTVPIGRPIANTTAYVVDGIGQPAPIGVVGELWLGGFGLALGYLGEPAMTAERFMLNPFHPGRVYRTGDLVRTLPDGALEFIGRADQQVKLRGFRIEPAEIEAACLSHDGVAQAVVLLREDKPGERRLVAYLVADAALAVPMLREHLQSRLPTYMQPAAIVLLDTLPLTANGKIDRAALPRPEQARPELDLRYAAPDTPLETAVVEVFGEVLGVQRVGVHDHFFRDLGGHSLLATQVISRLRQAVGADITLRLLFEQPTTAQLCRAIEHDSAGAARALDTSAPRLMTAPSSHAQRRLWFLAQLAPDSAFYNVPATLRIRGRVDDDAIERALQEIVRRHDMLRTTFVVQHGTPVQQVAVALHLALDRIDLADIPDERRETELQTLSAAAASRPFDLERGPLIRASLFHLAADEHVLLITLHHIVCDGWSLGVLFRELSAIYHAFLRHEPSPLPPLSRQYAFHAEEQRAWLEGGAAREQLDYWTMRLAGLQPLRLPLDHARPQVATYKGARCYASWPAELCDALRRLGAEHDCTLFMTLLATWATLLQRYSRSDDIAIGCPIANRQRGGEEDLIGFFVNTLVLRIDTSNAPGFRELLGRVRSRALEAYAHQDLPFELLVERLRPERSANRNPLFQVMFQLQTFASPADAVDTDDEPTLVAERGAATFDLSFDVWESGSGLRGFLEYSTDLFEKASIERMLDHFTRLLQAVAADPDAPIGSLPLLSDDEIRRQLAVDSRSPAPSLVPVHLGFVARARACPGATAVIAGERAWSYRELDDRSAAIAAALRARGIAVDATVAVLLEPGPELIATLLGVLGAGCAYVPLDLREPAVRHAWIASDAGVVAIVSRREPPLALARLPRIDPDDLTLSCTISEHAGRLAYVLYTSGSTGRPKGVAVGHESLAHHAREMGRLFGLESSDRVLQFASPGFDVAAEEIFPTLAAGAAIVIASDTQAMTPEELLALIARERITVVNLPSPFWGLWVDMLERTRMPIPDHLRLVVTGSAPVDLDRLRRWRRMAPKTRWMNAYGTTECTITCAVYEASEELELDGVVPIGRPLNGLQIHVVDEHLNLVPIGVIGELCVAGPCLARGYVGRPDLTARAFVPHPFRAGERLYRTGDLGRVRRDGLLEVHGREDDQVKLRGYRIELKEIEAVLREHPAVVDAAVMVREDRRDDRRIVAYVVQSPTCSGPGDLSVRWDEEQVERWQLIYDQLYEQGAGCAERGFDIVGWNSSYTGQAIPSAEMRAWLDHTLACIRERPAPRILEIGCGTGMLLLALALDAARYVGTDISEVALADLRRQLGPELAHVELRHQNADDFSELDGPFDLVVLNSVVQYFPGADYLRSVLASAIARVAAGGRIFLGDLRRLDLHAAFAASIELFHTPATTMVDHVQRALERRLSQEQELLLDPRFFLELARDIPTIGAVHVQLKRGADDNELTAFRYDVILEVGPSTASTRDDRPRWRDWEAEAFDVETLARILDEQSPEAFDLARVSNARVARAVEQLRQLRRADGQTTVAPVPMQSLDAIEPEAIRSVAETRGYHIALFPSGDPDGALFDARLSRHGVPTFRPSSWQHEGGGPASALANAPLSGAFARALNPVMQAWLAERLPEFMVPAAFVLVGALPRTAAGKLAKEALPRPDQLRPALDTPYAAPRGALEEALVRLWSELLAIEQVGVDDNFFTHLGGHSLVGTQLVARVRERLQLELPLHELFARPTIRQLAQLLEGAHPAPAPSDALKARPHPGPAPLSFSQQRIWFLCQLMPGTRAFNMPQAVELTGSIDVRLVGRALDEIVRRHSVLRTTFVAREGEPVQIVGPAQSVPIAVYELRELSPTARDARAADLLRQLPQVPLDLARGPLLRVALIHLTDDRHLLLLVVHHIVADGWSLGLFFSELSALVEAYRRGVTAVLPELRVQYADYADWQRRRFKAGAVGPQLALWRERLKAVPPLRLPTARSREALTTNIGAREGRTLDRELTRRINELARHEEATLFMTLLAAFAVLLHRSSGQQDFGVGTPMVNRQHTELEPLIGLFLSTLVLRMDLEGDPTFREFLGRVKERVVEAFANSDVPFERVVEELQPDRNLDQNPLFQVFFNLLNSGRSEPQLAGMPATTVAAGEHTSPFDMTLYALEEHGFLLLSMLYKRDLFDAATARAMLEQLEVLLRSIVGNPERRVSAHRLAPAAPTSSAPAMLADRMTRTRFPRAALNGSIADRFFEVARRHADRPAIIDQGRTWRYAELADEVVRITSAVRAQLGDRPQRVALLFRKSGENIAAMFGVLAAGHTYVPLDSSHPDARLRSILSDAAASLVLFDDEHRVRAQQLRGDAKGLAFSRLLESGAEPLPVVSPDGVAYLLYTSGTTGQPKGISQSQRNVVAHARCYARSIGITPDDRVSLLPSCSFDAAVMDIFGALLSGAALAPLDVREEGLATVLRRLANLTVLHATPTVFRALSQAVDRPLSGVRAVVLGGEAAYGGDVELFRRCCGPNAILVNGFGPSECTMALQFHVTADTVVNRTALPIGYPVEGVRVRVLNADGESVGVGGIGEIVLESPHLALGYWRQPQAAARVFTQSKAGRRRYRTGDLGRRLPDGAIEFVGRRDAQVKIRGHRIEPGEIEQALLRLDSVEEAVVAARRDEEGDGYLVAYLVQVAEQALPPCDLRERLADVLPGAMIPAAFVTLPELPLLANGKVDRAALPHPPRIQAGEVVAHVAPRTVVERRLADLWEGLLGVPNIGVHDHFFRHLGGHSLLAVQLMSRIRDHFRVEVPLRLLFEAPTVEGLARAIESAGGERTDTPIPKARRQQFLAFSA